MTSTSLPSRPWFLYVVQCADETYYTGISIDVARRVREHNAGRGAKYTASRRPVALRASWRFADRGGAMRAEIAFKRKARLEKGRTIRMADTFQQGCWALEEDE